MRQAARDYWTYASFGFILWREEESSLWWNMYVDLFAYVHPPLIENYSCSICCCCYLPRPLKKSVTFLHDFSWYLFAISCYFSFLQ